MGNNEYLIAAYERGVLDARCAASWTANGNTDVAAARRVLEMLRNGDPAADDYLPARPDLSGQWADDPTPLSLAREIVGREDVPAELVEAIAEHYEEGVRETFEMACELELSNFCRDDSSNDR